MKSKLFLFVFSLLSVISFGISPVMGATIDYGDAPDPTYATLVGNNGAGHTISDLFLGNFIDPDLDGQPDLDATGDDLDGIDDDDGVFFTEPLVPGSITSIDVIASINGGYLNAWIDYNKDGDWMDAGEWTIIDASLLAGTQSLSFQIPASAALGDTYARFRLTSTRTPRSAGVLEGGEVEDYKITIVDSKTPDPVPEPSTMLLFGSGLLGLAGVNRKKIKNRHAI